MVIELYDNKSSNIQTAVSTSTLTKCPSCGNEKIITDTESGEIICDKCGRVISDKSQDLGPEWRTFTTDETDVSTRTGVPQSLARHDLLSMLIPTLNLRVSSNAPSNQFY